MPISSARRYNELLYLSVTLKFYTEVLHQTLNPTAELWCKTSSQIKVDWFYTELKPYRFIFVCLFKSTRLIWCYLSWDRFKSFFYTEVW